MYFVCFSISRNILNRDMQSSMNMFNRKCNKVRLDFSILNSDIKSKLIYIFCMDCIDAVYGTLVKIMLTWRKAIRAIWKLLFRTHCNHLHGINDTRPIDVIFERRCIKFTWTLLHSPNIIVKSVIRSTIRSRYSTVVEN